MRCLSYRCWRYQLQFGEFGRTTQDGWVSPLTSLDDSSSDEERRLFLVNALQEVEKSLPDRITSLPLTTTCTATASQQHHLPIASALQHASGSWSGVVGYGPRDHDNTIRGGRTWWGRLAAFPMSTTLPCSQTRLHLQSEPWTHPCTQARVIPWLCAVPLSNGSPMAATASLLSWSTLDLSGDLTTRLTNSFGAYHLLAVDAWQHLSTAFVRKLQPLVWTHGLPCSRTRNTRATTSCCSRTLTEVSYSRPMPKAGPG